MLNTGDGVDEMNAALIQQLMEEDASQLAAEQMQSEFYGGGADTRQARPA